MDWDESKFPNTDPNLTARGKLSDGTVWHEFRRPGEGVTYRFEKANGFTSYVELTGEQMMLIADRTYNS
jgi:hypothetical protein